MRRYNQMNSERAKETSMSTWHYPIRRCAACLLFGAGVLLGLAAVAAPTLTVNSPLAYTEDEGAKFADNSATLTDSKAIKSVTVQITTAYDDAEDELGTGSLAGLNITANWNSGTGTLELTPTVGTTETVAEFEDALQYVTYENTNTYDPDDTARVLTYIVTNEDDDTDTATLTINITTTNDAPTYTGANPTVSAAIVWPAVDEPRVKLTCTIPAGVWSDDETAPGALNGPFYQWQYDSTGGGAWNDIGGATSADYTVEDAYYGYAIRCETSVDDGFLPTTQASDETDAMQDDDSDMLVNAYEDGNLVASDSGTQDSDADKIIDGKEYGFDADSSGLLTPDEFLDFDNDGDIDTDDFDVDGDGTENALDTNSDSDGILVDDQLTDDQEDMDDNGTVAGDTNGNHRIDAGETWTEPSPYRADSDGDGILDGKERFWDVDQSNADEVGGDGAINAADTDSDDDGLEDGEEDVDGDGMIAGDDGDYIFEPETETWTETDPTNDDSDGDGIVDGAEPSWNVDTDGDGFINALDTDSDNDGLPDNIEDTDLDGKIAGDDGTGGGTANNRVRDGDEVWTETDPLNPDTDGDGILDGDEDANQDGVIAGDDGDRIFEDGELWTETDPLNNDSDGDGIKDGFDGRYDEATDTYAWDADLDADNLINALDKDSDGDSLRDDQEDYVARLDLDADPNADGSPIPAPPVNDDANGNYTVDAGEAWTTTSSYNYDTDGDTMPDNWEDQYGLDPLDGTDGVEDEDGGSLDNANEYAKNRDPLDPTDDMYPDQMPEKVAFAEKIGVPVGTVEGRDVKLTKVVGLADQSGVFAGNFSPKITVTTGLNSKTSMSTDSRSSYWRHNAFVGLMEPDRNWKWIVRLYSGDNRSSTSTLADYIEVHDMASYGDYVYVIGEFEGDLTYFRPGAAEEALSGDVNRDEVFVLKLSKRDGSLIRYTISTTTSGWAHGTGIAANENGVYVCGDYGGDGKKVDLCGETPRAAKGGLDMFVAKLTHNLETCSWIKGGGGEDSGTNRDHAAALTLDAGGQLLLTGTIHGSRGHKISKRDDGGSEGWCEYAEYSNKKPGTFQGSSIDFYTGEYSDRWWVDACNNGGGGGWTQLDELYHGYPAWFVASFSESDGSVTDAAWDRKGWGRGHDVLETGGNIYVACASNNLKVPKSSGDLLADGEGSFGLLVKLDSNLDALSAVMVDGTGGDDRIIAIASMPGDSTSLVVGGRYGNPSAQFGIAAPGGPTGGIGLNSNGGSHVFVGRVNVSAMSWTWANSTSATKLTPPNFIDIEGLYYLPPEDSSAEGRIFYGGTFYGEAPRDKLYFGDDTTEVVLEHVPVSNGSGDGYGTTSFLSAFTAGGKHLDMVLMEVVSEYGHGTVFPGIGQFYYLQDSRVLVEWPYRIYPEPDKIVLANGTHLGADGTATLSDTGKDFRNTVEVGHWVRNVTEEEATGNPAYGRVTGVTRTTLTCNGVTFDTGDDYEVLVYDPGLLQKTIRDPESPEEGTENYPRRYTCTGYTLGDPDHAEPGTRIEFVIRAYTRLKINWVTEFKLKIMNEVVVPEDDDITAEALNMLGDPDPGVGVNWIEKAAEIAPRVDGAFLAQNVNEYGSRYLLTSYVGTGVVPNNPDFVPTEGRIQIGRSSTGEPFFVMTGPGTLTYRWEKQYRIQVSTVDSRQETLPGICLFGEDFPSLTIDDAGGTVTRNGKVYRGTGEFYFSHGVDLWIMTEREWSAEGKSLKGWELGDGHFPYSKFPPLSGDGSDKTLDEVLDWVDVDDGADTTEYYALKVGGADGFTEPTKILWSYGDTIHYLNIAIGNATNDTTDANQTVIFPKLQPGGPRGTTAKPTVRAVDVPPGTTVDDMYIWDDVLNKHYPLRPGMVILEWVAKNNPDLRIITHVTSGFSGDEIPDYPGNPDYTAGPPEDTGTFDAAPDADVHHVAQTPRIDLDPSRTDDTALIGDRFYFERAGTGGSSLPGTGEALPDTDDLGVISGQDLTGDATLDVDGTFGCDVPGRSVLVFSRSLEGVPAVGDLAKESILVKVVRTKRYTDDEGWGTATSPVGSALLRKHLAVADTLPIGQPVASSYDTAGIGTGYLFFATGEGYTGCYNANIYNPDAEYPENYGPIIPVNQMPYAADPDDTDMYSGINVPVDPAKDMLVVWYEEDSDTHTVWPYLPALYRRFGWPADWRIVIASRLGSEGLDATGTPQYIDPADELYFDPDRFQDVVIYNQPDADQPGYNPNEEHALIAPSYAARAAAVRPPTAYALRNDLNESASKVTASTADSSTWDTYTSDPYVLVQYYDVENDTHAMAVYRVEADDDGSGGAGAFAGDERVEQDLDKSETGKHDAYEFMYFAQAGQFIIPPYPLDLVIGVNPCNDPAEYWKLPHGAAESPRPDPPTVFETCWEQPLGTVYIDSRYQYQRTFWVDHRGQGWVVSGNPEADLQSVNWAAGNPLAAINCVKAKFFYALRTDFWYPEAEGKDVGDCIPWKVQSGASTGMVTVTYPTAWPEEVPTLKAGETLTYAGGEYRADNPAAPGLPGVIGWAAGEIVYDDLNPTVDSFADTTEADENWTVRIVSPLEELRVDYGTRDNSGTLNDANPEIPEELRPAGGRVRVKGKEYIFTDLSASLQRRIFFDSITKEFGIRGFVNNRTLGDSDLTAAPPPTYVLEPNVLTPQEKQELLDVLPEDESWTDSVEALYALTRNPKDVPISSSVDDFMPGLMTDSLDNSKAQLLRSLGPGLAVIPNQRFLDPTLGLEAILNVDPDTGNHIAYVTLAENNDDDLGAAPVALHLFKVVLEKRYRGAVMVVYSDNAFDEKIVLRHTGDFGTNTDQLYYQWWIKEEDGTVAPLPATESPDPWGSPFSKSGVGAFQVSLEGTGPVILRDNLVFMRYRHVNENPPGAADWTGTKWDDYYDDPDVMDDPAQDGRDGMGEWAGAANSPDVDGNFRPQLVMGWVKRVLDAINPYEARISDLTDSDSPATYVSMIRQFGPRYEGQVALNPDKDVIENHGLIELYQTVLNRAMDLSIDLTQPANTPGVTNAILLAATRLSDFYTILGDTAWTDAMDPTIGIGSDSIEYGSLAPAIYCFMNQQPSLLGEELALLRGVDDTYGRPVYNRLFWNFTKSQGEVAYALNYNIGDVTNDGFINEYDAMKLFPQGHGDAWGHYLTAATFHYDLLRHPYFNWISRSEFYNLMDVVIDVDFLDERRFAEVAAAKARTGRQILNLTYREHYVDDPDGQWQGYVDVDEDRAWGVTGWARRAGQGALFDWVTANAIVPAVAPPKSNGEPREGIEKIERSTVLDIAEISSQLKAIQGEYDAANNGLNPLGVDANAVPFDIDPVRISWEAWEPTSHFEQIAERAEEALKNARIAFDYANEQKNRLRQVEQSAEDLFYSAVDQDLSYRNQLIEIFGTPYAGQIGTGKAFPAGYSGPDTMLYMYVDKTRINTDAYDANTGQGIKYVDAVFSYNFKDTIPTSLEEWYDDDMVKNPKALSVSELYTMFMQTAGVVAEDPAVTTNLELPITAGTYAFAVPDALKDEWGQRACVGELQRIISEMIVAQAEVDANIKRYQMNIAGLNLLWTQIVVSGGAAEWKIKDMMGYAIAKEVFDKLIMINDAIIKACDDAVDTTTSIEGITMTPMIDPVTGMAFTIPVGSTMKVVTKTVGFATKTGFKIYKGISEAAKIIGTIAFDEAKLALDIKNFKVDQVGNINGPMREFLTNAGDEKVEAIAILQSAERVNQLAEQYRTTLEKGIRLMEERANWNRKLAASVQKQRYADMGLRVSRNKALANYHTAFELAARYCYLAAKAYDYETNFDDNDPGSPRDLFAEIVRQRTLGQFVDDEPVIGVPGLADCMARLEANYKALKGQMGFNNPQTETGKFSLRRELLRIGDDMTVAEDDDAWKGELEQYRVGNLWDVWEFRHYCRPFAAYDPDEPQPGIVIPFSTQVIAGLNFFGWPGGPGDHSYDPSNFATKIRSVGLWFTNYDTSALMVTPRVYLVPSGMDIMTIPTDDDLKTRQWQVVNQRIPIPYPLTDSDFDAPDWVPVLDSLSSGFSDVVRMSSFRVYHDVSEDIDEDELIYDSRLVGRSVWNTKWVLIVPGITLLGQDPEEGLNRFIYGRMIDPNGDPNDVANRDGNGVSDIRLFFQTYSHGGG